MLTQSERIAEIIAHFIGYFEIQIDELRVKQTFDSFHLSKQQTPETSSHTAVVLQFEREFTIEPYDPGVSYKGLGFHQFSVHGAKLGAHSEPLHASGPHLPFHGHGMYHAMPLPHFQTHPTFFGADPGSIGHQASQAIYLFDNDVTVLPDIAVEIHYHFGAVAKFDTLVQSALELGEPFSPHLPLEAGAETIQFFDQLSQAITDAPSSELGQTPGVIVVSGEDAAGSFINGVLVAPDEVPVLGDLLPEAVQAKVDSPVAEPSATPLEVTLNGADTLTSMSLEAGGNLAANSTVIVNAGLVGTHVAVMGDYHELNVIVQTNAYSDIDAIGSGFGDGAVTAQQTTISVNVASLVDQTMDLGAEAAAANPGLLPLAWTVSVVDGDVVFMDWVSQYTFMSDSDVTVLAASGSTTTITAGSNVDLNGVGFAELGLHYDVVIIGGSLYDANLISQTNVLFDDDTLEMLGSRTDLGSGTVSTSGNLLYNSATIQNIGPAEWEQGIPKAYSDAVASIENGSYAMPDHLMTDAALEGIGNVKVLYIKGDVYDLHAIKQVNVVGDADYVAIYRDKVMSSAPDAGWDISTGSNALVNTAIIIDYDSVGTTAHVGGEVYSDAILIQAEIIDGSPNVLSPQSDALASEVVAFLDDDSADHFAPDHDSISVSISVDGPPADIMQSVLA